MNFTTTHEGLINSEEKRRIEECLIMGRLADDGPGLPSTGIEQGRAVSLTTFAGPDKVIFYIKSLSEEPFLLMEKLGKRNEEVFVTFDNRNKTYLDRFKYFTLNDEEKVEFLRSHFINKPILFKPKLTYGNQERYHYNLEMQFVETEPFTLEDSYFTIPHVKKGLPHNRFEKAMIEGKPIELPSYNHGLELPEFIICDKYLYRLEDDAFEKYPINDNLYLCKKPSSVKRIDIPSKEEFKQLTFKEVSFVPYSTKMDFNDLPGQTITELNKAEEQRVKKSERVNKDNKANKINEDNSKSRTNSNVSNNIAENEFIAWLHYLAEKNNLVYESHDLINFHTSMKTARFSILGGMSGTGKSKLARVYADALGLEEGKNLLFIPVSPSFTEPSDVLGFLNPQTGLYLESETGLISFLVEAKKKPRQLHMVVFDEMNLGQVEHYFSPFISLLEGEEDERILRLFSKNHFSHHPDLKEIKIGSNVLFVGTANFDETTKDFSNRMLDRSNVILLEKKRFIEAKKEEEKAAQNILEYQNKTLSSLEDPNPVSKDNFLSWINKESGLSSLEDDELIVLDKLHEEISNFDSQTGVSFRIAKSIGHYLENIPKDEDGYDLFSRELAFDYQIKQRILTKIRGHRDQIENLVGFIDEEENYRDGRIGHILPEEDNQFFISRRYLKQKAKELMRNGYTM
ncbi:McrB family protein [Alteribacter keqinensis]|uniref:ATPase dynein-related AAA domain-containing protein n=1 Tax=Alteribacter keqinensis TaxID=2483800 RepID=A0A3M7TTL0_9BACI|nr:hypothetical protein [Alteribacter keqinensis]RNA68551.1 hypothetical protein EBO34_00840 [Alteribacter keqinensis]